MSTANPMRVTAGVPNGGQFAVDPRSESGVEFDDWSAPTAPGIAEQLGVAPGERISSRHPDFVEIDGSTRVVTDEYGEVAEHASAVYHHLPSGRLVGAQTIGDPYAPNYDGAPDPVGSDLFEISSGDNLDDLHLGAHVHQSISRHLAQVPIVDDSMHLTPARVQQCISANLPAGVVVVSGGVGFFSGSFGREAPGARGPDPAAVGLSARMSNGNGTSYTANVTGGTATVFRRNAFGAAVRGQVALTDASPAGVGAAITTALAETDRKDDQRAALVDSLRSRLPLSFEPPFYEDDDGSFSMVVPIPRRGAGQYAKPRSFGVKVTAEGEVTVAKNSLTSAAQPLETRSAQIPAGSDFTAAADSIAMAIGQMRDR